MLKKYLLIMIGIVVLAASCTTPVAITKTEVAKSESEAFNDFSKQKNDGVHFGAPVTTKDAFSYDAILPLLQKTDTLKNVKVAGVVDAVCKARGCWMNIKSETGAAPMFVKFKDYAFFMPKDLAGKRIVMSGDAFKEIISVDELRHYAEDDGKSKEDIAKITQPQTKIRFVASGVVINK